MALKGDMREKVDGGKGKKRACGYEEDESDKDDNKNGKGEGSSSQPHPESPAAHGNTADDRMAFLLGLSNDSMYQKFVKELEKKMAVS